MLSSVQLIKTKSGGDRNELVVPTELSFSLCSKHKTPTHHRTPIHTQTLSASFGSVLMTRLSPTTYLSTLHNILFKSATKTATHLPTPTRLDGWLAALAGWSTSRPLGHEINRCKLFTTFSVNTVYSKCVCMYIVHSGHVKETSLF